MTSLLNIPPSISINQYDVIVIGGGLSGLTAAAFLAQAGARLLVCEQAAQVGGLFNSFQREGYQFDGGIKAVENSSVMMPMLAQLGLLEKIEFHRSPIALLLAGRLQPIKSFADVAAYFQLLGELFPDEQTSLKNILDDTKTVFELLNGMLSFPIPFFDLPGNGPKARSDWFKNHGGILSRLPRAAALMNKELRPYLEQQIRNPGLVNLLSDLFPDGTSVFFGLGYFRMFLDYYYPRGGIRTIPQTLAHTVEAGQGEIRCNTRVEQILLKDGQARGIRLATGEEIRAGYIIAASDLRRALTRLLPEGVLPSGFDHRLRRAGVSHSVLNVFLGVNRSPESLNLDGYAHVFYAPDLEGISEIDRINREDYFSHVPQEISVPCLHDPLLAPPRKTGLNLSAMASWEYNGGWDCKPADYQKLKEGYAAEMIASLEKYIPGLSKNIEFCDIATPRTIYSLTSNTHGAIMGWSYHRQDTLPRSKFYQMRSSVLTPIPRLLVAGHWAFSPGGSPVAVLTGKLAAENVINKLINN